MPNVVDGMAPDRARRRIPDATVSRLPVYLRILGEQADERVESISSERLAELAGVNAAKVRKDLSYLGSYGTRGVGYEVGYLVYQIRRELGLTHDWPVVIVGAGNLGQALAGYGGFGERGFPVAGIVDIDEAKVPPSGSTSASSPRRARRPRTLPTVWCAPASPASSTSRPPCCRCRGPSRCARSTSPWSCRSSATTNSVVRVAPSTSCPAARSGRRARRVGLA